MVLSNLAFELWLRCLWWVITAVNSWAWWMIEGWLNWLRSWVGVVTATLESSVPSLGDFWKSWEAHLYGVDLLSLKVAWQM